VPSSDRHLTLAIEASNPSAASGGSGPGVAAGLVGSGGSLEVLGVEMLRSTARHDDDLMPAIDRLWARVGAPRSAIRRVAVSIGPGGYTGLRVAIVGAKLIAEAVGAMCVGVPSALVVARRAAPDTPAPFAVALASKAETTVVSVFRERGGTGSIAREIGASELADLNVRAIIADRHLPLPIRARCTAAGVRIDEPVFDPVACLEASGLVAPVEPARLLPIYGREPEAVRKWREMHPGG